MQYKLRTRVLKYRAAAASAASSNTVGTERTARLPLLSSEMPTRTPTPTVTLTRTPTPSPTLTPTVTPSQDLNPTPSPTVTLTPTPTPTLGFAYSTTFTGPGENEELMLFVSEEVPFPADVFYLNNVYTPTYQTYTMNVYINNELRTRIEFDSGRAGTQFGYKKASTVLNVPEFVGTFTNVSPAQSLTGGNVFFS